MNERREYFRELQYWNSILMGSYHWYDCIIDLFCKNSLLMGSYHWYDCIIDLFCKNSLLMGSYTVHFLTKIDYSWGQTFHWYECMIHHFWQNYQITWMALGHTNQHYYIYIYIYLFIYLFFVGGTRHCHGRDIAEHEFLLISKIKHQISNLRGIKNFTCINIINILFLYLLMGILIILKLIHTLWIFNNGRCVIINLVNFVNYKSIGLHIQLHRKSTTPY